MRKLTTKETPDLRSTARAMKQHGAFSRMQAFEDGHTSTGICRRVNEGKWNVLYRGIYVPAGVRITWKTRLMGAILKGGPETVASHRSAAALHGLLNGEPAIEIVTPRKISMPKVSVTRTRLDASEIRTIDAIPVTKIERTLIDLAAVVSGDVLQDALDAALRKGLTVPRRVLAKLDALQCRGRKGVGTLRRLLGEDPDAPPPSWLERRFLRLLSKLALSDFLREYPMFGGRRRIDFAWPHLALGIEVHGAGWHPPARWSDDWARHNELTADGWSILHFTWQQISDEPDLVERTIRMALGQAALTI
jgi:very-short-patch-repair endonuclease